MSKYDSKSTTFPRIQELASITLFKCLNYYSKTKKGKYIDEFLQCNQDSIKPVKQEIFKRFYKPIGIPLIALLTCLIILVPKEHKKYNVFKLISFLLVIFVIVIFETSLRYAGHNMLGTFFFILFPPSLFLITYVGLFKNLKR